MLLLFLVLQNTNDTAFIFIPHPAKQHSYNSGKSGFRPNASAENKRHKSSNKNNSQIVKIFVKISVGSMKTRTTKNTSTEATMYMTFTGTLFGIYSEQGNATFLSPLTLIEDDDK